MPLSGSELKIILKRNKLKISDVSKKISKSRSFLYNQLEHEVVAPSLLAEITAYFGIDFKSYLAPENLSQYVSYLKHHNISAYQDESIKVKYLELLEEHMQLFQKYTSLLESKV